MEGRDEEILGPNQEQERKFELFGHQIQVAEAEENKITFYVSDGVAIYTKFPGYGWEVTTAPTHFPPQLKERLMEEAEKTAKTIQESENG